MAIKCPYCDEAFSGIYGLVDHMGPGLLAVKPGCQSWARFENVIRCNCGWMRLCESTESGQPSAGRHRGCVFLVDHWERIGGGTPLLRCNANTGNLTYEPADSWYHHFAVCRLARAAQVGSAACVLCGSPKDDPGVLYICRRCKVVSRQRTCDCMSGADLIQCPCYHNGDIEPHRDGFTSWMLRPTASWPP